MSNKKPGTGCSPYASEKAARASSYLPAANAFCPLRNCSRARNSAASFACAGPETARGVASATTSKAASATLLILEGIDEAIVAYPFWRSFQSHPPLRLRTRQRGHLHFHRSAFDWMDGVFNRPVPRQFQSKNDIALLRQEALGEGREPKLVSRIRADHSCPGGSRRNPHVHQLLFVAADLVSYCRDWPAGLGLPL